MPAFEFDPNKSASNRAKHGIDFVEAQELWKGMPRQYELGIRDEVRYLVVGKIKGKHWTAIITYRGNAIRIIFARRSAAEETQRYEQDAKARRR